MSQARTDVVAPEADRQAKLLSRLKGLLHRARRSEKRLPEIRQLAELRQQRMPRMGTPSEWKEWQEVNEPIEEFFRSWAELAGEIRAALADCEAFVPKREVKAWSGRISDSFVSPAVEVLEEVIARLEQFAPPIKTPSHTLETPEEREQAVEEFCRRLGCSKADIYHTAKVHKSDFYKWLKGEIPSGSVVAQRIEKVLSGEWPLKRGGG
ncbi:MAG: hypothetical protein NZ554_12415 [Bryobacteraceae bacterium]|nr:hypothetical protein [Bryobacteraceae bacterium]